jgi:hypothetical protein
MLESRVIEQNGVFVGAAVRLDRGYRFVAVNGWLAEMDGTLWPDLDELRRATARGFAQRSFAPAACAPPARAAAPLPLAIRPAARPSR